MKFLITGASSGLGKHLFEFFDGIPFTRETSEQEFNNLKKNGVDIIIHAAFNSSKDITSNNLYSYIKDNVLLTQELITIPHKKFIFISSVDIYPKNNTTHKEEEIININSVTGIYGITKLISESIIMNFCSDYLILRCATLLGKYSRKNTFLKLFEEESPSPALSAKSFFNYILHTYVSDFIKLAIKKDLKGIYNLASSKNISLVQVAKQLNKKVNFGNYTYNVGQIDNKKAATLISIFRKTSQEVITEFTFSHELS